MRKSYFSCLLLMVFGFAQAQIVVSIAGNSTVCNVDETVSLTASYAVSEHPTNYTVEQSPSYNPFPYSGGTMLVVPPAANNIHDFWSSAITLPFSFRFYGHLYRDIQIGSNGLLTFGAPYGYGALCNWIGASEMLPNMDLYPNSIYGVYQDLDFSNRGIGSINYYVLDTGIYAAPNRVFVCNFNQIPSWNDLSAGRQTSQIVLYESNDNIGVNVERRVAGNQWNGAGLIGIQNIDATKFLTPTGRNTGSWSAQNEGWIFKPYWENLPVAITWTSNGQTIGTGNILFASVEQLETTFTATASYTESNGFLHTSSDTHTVVVEPLNVSDPINLYLCQNQQTIDLTVNDAIVTGGNAGDYIIRYYTNLVSAQNGTPSNRITTPANYTLQSAEQTIYMRIMDINGAGCIAVKEFQVSVGSDETPSGAQNQYFTTGQTLNDLIVTGGTITWYDATTGGNLLSGTTLLQNGVTYYAENSSITACQNKQTLAERLAVTAFTTLGTNTFNTSKLVAYPNPVSNILKIVNSEILNQVDIYNAVGRLVLAKTANSKEVNIEVSVLVNGVYFAKVSSGENNATIKFIKN